MRAGRGGAGRAVGGPAGPGRTCRPPRLLQVKAAPGYPLSASSSSWIILPRGAPRAAGSRARAAGKGGPARRRQRRPAGAGSRRGRAAGRGGPLLGRVGVRREGG